MNNAITIASTSIRQDSYGRYCLNDLHRAAGGEPKHAPSQWSRYSAAQELAAEIRRQQSESRSANSHIDPVSSVYGGMEGQGTFVMKELVYAYAMWISAKFHLQVIRAYDQMVTAPKSAAIPPSFREALLLAAEQASRIEELDRANAAFTIAHGCT